MNQFILYLSLISTITLARSASSRQTCHLLSTFPNTEALGDIFAIWDPVEFPLGWYVEYVLGLLKV